MRVSSASPSTSSGLTLNNIVTEVLAFIPVFIIGYAFLVWPLVYGESLQGDIFLDNAPATVKESGNDPLNRIYYPLGFLIAIGLFVLKGRSITIQMLHPAMLMLGVVLLMCLFSLIWSHVPTTGFRRLIIQTLILSGLFFSIFSLDKPETVFLRLFFLFSGLVLLNLIAIFIYPPSNIGHEGIYPHKNYLGFVMAIAFLFCLHQIFTGSVILRAFAFAFALIALFVLLKSQSKTSLGLAFLAPIAALGVTLAAQYLRMSAGVTIILFVGLVIGAFYLGEALFIFTFDDVATFLFNDPTITQRTVIWEFGGNMIDRRPWLGYGFGSFWDAGANSPHFREAPGFVIKLNHGHNGYMDMVLQTGYIGLFFFLSFLFLAANAAGRVVSYSFSTSWIILTILIFAMAHNLLETNWLFSFATVSSVAFCAIFVAIKLARSLPTRV